MNKQELVDAVAAATGQSWAVALKTLEIFVGTITTAATKADALQLIDFGAPRGRAQSVDRRRNSDRCSKDSEVHRRC